MKKNIMVSTILTCIMLSLLLCPSQSLAAKYTVTKSDSLFKISTLFKTPVSKIKSINKLKSNELRPGQVLNVPARSYMVKRGDTLKKIADKHKIKIGALRKANAEWDNEIVIGKKLILPGIKPKKEGKKTASKKSAKTATVKVASLESRPVISYTKAEFDLLARLITAETTGQPYKAMVAVGGVVVNRVQSKEWPSTIKGVINHVSAGYYQFTPVKNGYINKPASNIAKKAAKSALLGSDPSKGAMFYFDDSATNTWLWSKPILVRFGNMVFVE